MASSHSSSEHVHTEAPTLLEIPAEVRDRIYESLFAGLTFSASPGRRDLGSGSRMALIQRARSPMQISSLVGLLGPSSGHFLRNTGPVGHPMFAPDRQPVNLSILVACRKIYSEAYPALLRFAVFRLTTLEDHIRMMHPQSLPLLGQLRKLSVTDTFLTEWSPTLVRLVLPALSYLEIRDLESSIEHDSMLKLDSMLANVDGAKQYTEPLSIRAGLGFFGQVFLKEQDRSIIVAIVSHFLAAAEMYNCLVLHAAVKCSGDVMGPHDHPTTHFICAFGDQHKVPQGPSLTTLCPKDWAETVFVYCTGFSVGDGNWGTSDPHSSFEAEDSTTG